MTAGRHLLLPLLGLLVGIAPLSGQDQRGSITGRVFDSATEQPLAGAAVTVAERTSLTGLDGRFIVTGVPAGEHTLRVTQIGYREFTRGVTLAAGQSANVQVSLIPEAIQLERLLVTGYGQRRAADITGSIEAVTDEEFNTGRVISPEHLIQGKVAGLQILDTGEPGGGVAIRIRGGTSVNASNEPLFVIDGVPLPQGGGLS
ncbi:MAG: carboxypeptidase regulatory-like domain-containing protein, partial [Gemmatimonadetes bacterium]|nr:carboxypeptidase regulatory-like domain-containing protein [Gemmatimonadota bacterium]